ncbi:PREDICTED: acylglycerol kinase, mitochondrial-like [Amphimedon queenslandica]|uniref:DAGKc domain-containing protein n=1 Tax=Amphimedon queenslandica TaxID=400682 RepID=A0AAN0J631_AMPQE|nr:PREDICTED: acylglycerol kinase, mitochondrial-like [Amphimedon queenslandica]|eukprot:XP_019852171.1 PREDICTED: acylglycerol kinase, mitochondrial-like [Amphimedon queenslandica]
MAAAWRHFKRNWKIYGIFFGTWLGSRWGAKRYREAAITRSYCLEAKQYSEKPVSLMDKIDRIYLFLNPKSNNSNAKKLFMKYSAPIFNLSGTEIILIESDYEGQIQSLINYIQSSGTAALVVAGGSGTLLEVVNGLLRRNGLSVPVGVLPLGKDNSFYYSQLRERKGKNELPARSIGEATMNIIRGNTKPVNIIKLQPEKGKTLYAVSSVKWGVVHDAEINKNSWRLFGLLRTFLSYTSTAVRVCY